jgi:hypothetical protein
MLARHFEKTTAKTYFFGLTISFIVIFFIHFCLNNGSFVLELIPRTLVFFLIFTGFILLISFLENKSETNSFSAIHLLVFPMIFLFFPQSIGLSFPKIIMGLFLIFSKYSFFRIFKEKNSHLRVFDLSFILSLLLLQNRAFVLFYIIPVITILFYKKFRDIKHFIFFLIPVFVIHFSFQVINGYFPDKFLASSESINFINNNFFLWNNPISETPWILLVFGAVLVTIFQRPKRYVGLSSGNSFHSFIFMSLWLYLSIIFSVLELNIGQGKWILSFIPVAYFVGHFIQKLHSPFFKNTIIYIFFIVGIFHKLYELKII